MAKDIMESRIKDFVAREVGRLGKSGLAQARKAVKKNAPKGVRRVANKAIKRVGKSAVKRVKRGVRGGITVGGRAHGGIVVGGKAGAGSRGGKIIGSRAQVMHGTADQTSGGLTKKDLKYNKQGRIVSAKKSAMAKKRFADSGLKPASKAEMAQLRAMRR